MRRVNPPSTGTDGTEAAFLPFAEACAGGTGWLTTGERQRGAAGCAFGRASADEPVGRTAFRTRNRFAQPERALPSRLVRTPIPHRRPSAPNTLDKDGDFRVKPLFRGRNEGEAKVWRGSHSGGQNRGSAR